MTNPTNETSGLADVAAQDPEQSVAEEQLAVGDHDDAGPVVPEREAAHEQQGPRA